MESVRRTDKYTKSVESRRSQSQYAVKSLSWVIPYDGKPFDLELVILIITPVWVAILLGFAVNLCCCKKSNETSFQSRPPQITLAALQQTKMEQRFIQSSLNLDFYAKKFIIRANDPYVDIDAIFKYDRERRVSNPWGFARQVPKWIAWYLKYKTPPVPSTKRELPKKPSNMNFEDEIADYKSKIWKP